MTTLTDIECERLLEAQYYGHLGCCDGDEPYVVPITYAYRDGYIYGYTHEGRKIEIVRRNPKVCVQIENVKNENEWESVICWGMFEEITDPNTIRKAKLLLAEERGKFVLSGKEVPVSPLIADTRASHEESTVVYRIKPTRMTGKAERV